MRFLLPLLLAAVLALSTVAPVAAHVRGKGTIKVNLNKERPTFDDFAFFIEPYVHYKLYLGRYDQAQNRFYVASFRSVEQHGNEAEVFFTVLDNKELKQFAESMRFTRRADGVWVYLDAQHQAVPVFVYEKCLPYYYRTYKLSYGFGIGGAVLVALLAGWLIHRQRRQLAGQD